MCVVGFEPALRLSKINAMTKATMGLAHIRLWKFAYIL